MHLLNQGQSHSTHFKPWPTWPNLHIHVHYIDQHSGTNTNPNPSSGAPLLCVLMLAH